jgi:hypothetical protein
VADIENIVVIVVWGCLVAAMMVETQGGLNSARTGEWVECVG